MIGRVSSSFRQTWEGKMRRYRDLPPLRPMFVKLLVADLEQTKRETA